MSEYITILCLLPDVSAQKQIPYSLGKALLHLVNFLHPKWSTFLRVPLVRKVWCNKELFSFHPLHPHISIHILHTLLYMFPLVWIRRICFTIKASQVGNHFLYSCDINEWFSSITARRELDAGHPLSLKGYFNILLN